TRLGQIRNMSLFRSSMNNDVEHMMVHYRLKRYHQRPSITAEVGWIKPLKGIALDHPNQRPLMLQMTRLRTLRTSTARLLAPLRALARWVARRQFRDCTYL
ncbi:MAG: hypothetical protein KDJ99_13290, partial [Candidatus Competibacteraceae bacterium]|nr:hypothetical protein [Candidatus Competibacteraceae bacterium]